MRPKTLLGLLVLSLCLVPTTVIGSPAQAESLVYLDAGKDIAAAQPDGSGARKLVDNGFNKGPISVDGAGRIAYFYSTGGSPFHNLIDKEGKDLGGPFIFGNMGLCGYVSPFRSASSPDGTWIAATYFHGNDCSTAGFTLTTRLIAANGPTADDSIYGSFTNMKEPRFLPQNQALLSGIVNGEIDIWQAPDDPHLVPWIGLNDPNWEIDSFDYDPSQNRMIMEQSPTGNPEGGEARDFLLLDFSAPAGTLSPRCSYGGLVASSDQAARPRYSPDGKMIAWNGPDGIYVSSAPTGASGTCSLSPRLVIPGGSAVEWAPFDLSSPPAAGKLQVVGLIDTSRAAFRKGAKVKVKVPASGLVKVTASVSKAAAKSLKLARRPRGAVTVASGRLNPSQAGTVSVKLKPTAKVKSAWRKLTGVRVTLKAIQGSRSATATVKLSR